jgi:hypothetical protein
MYKIAHFQELRARKKRVEKYEHHDETQVGPNQQQKAPHRCEAFAFTSY